MEQTKVPQIVPNGGKPVPRLWDGGRAYIVGGGPSASLVQWECLRGKRVLACNAASFLLPFGIPQVGLFGDKVFLRHFRTQLRGFVDQGGLLIYSTNRPILERDYSWITHVRRIDGTKNWGIHETPDRVRWNRTTGGCALNVAYLLGARELVLIGFDMKMTGKAHNWHSEYLPYYKEGKMSKPDPEHYQNSFSRPFRRIAEDLRRLGVVVWNTCLDSALSQFPYRPLEELLWEE